jgi:hypothetical protein
MFEILERFYSKRYIHTVSEVHHLENPGSEPLKWLRYKLEMS